MKGDKIIVQDFHIKAAEQIRDLLLPLITETEGRFIVTIAGESGSGKSEIAQAFSDLLSQGGMRSIILQQDDYFKYPPKTNERMRRQNIDHVGLSEVNLDTLEENLKSLAEGRSEIEKPLVIFYEDRIVKEVIRLEGTEVVIVEGTYATLLKTPHQRIFIDRTYLNTRDARKLRDREEQGEFLEGVLKIEHEIILSHKPRADIIVTSDYQVRRNEDTGR
jgi:uridine kinase